jgi:hypothetical protein
MAPKSHPRKRIAIIGAGRFVAAHDRNDHMGRLLMHSILKYVSFKYAKQVIILILKLAGGLISLPYSVAWLIAA